MQGHGKAVDWWAFGVLVYEMMAGYPPFYEEDTTQTYQRILHGKFTFPSDFPVTARDLVRKLLQVRQMLYIEGFTDLGWYVALKSMSLNFWTMNPTVCRITPQSVL